MTWVHWALIIAGILILVRGVFVWRLGADVYGPDFRLALGIGIMCAAVGLGIVLAVSIAVSS